MSTATIFPRLLNRRARDITIRAKDTTVPCQWLQSFLAMLAFIEKPACVGRHGFGGDRLAMRARNRGNSLHQAPPSARISGCSIKLHKADRTIIAVAIRKVSRALLPRAGFSQPYAPKHRTLRKWRPETRRIR